MRGRKLSRSKSRRNFSKGNKTHRFNLPGRIMRGGIRL